MLYQSVGSSTCAISATANLLQLYGMTCSRQEARQLFGLSDCGSTPAVTHPVLRRVIEGQLCNASLCWKRYSNLAYGRLCRALKITLHSGSPALLTFHIRHPHRNWTGVHCTVAINVDDAGIHVIDSLGRRDGRLPNAAITPKESALGWRVSGAPLIVTRGPFQVLEGLPSFRETLSEVE